MNPDAPIDPRSALEADLTALLLGELPHDQAAALHQKLAQDPELAALYDRLKHTINWVRETISSPAEQAAAPLIPLRLEERRRQKLLQQFKTVAPREFAHPRRRTTRWLLPVSIVAAAVVMGAAFLHFTLAPRFQLMSKVGTEVDEQMARLSHDAASLKARTSNDEVDKALQLSGQPAPEVRSKYFDGQDRSGGAERYASEGVVRRAVTAIPAPPSSAAKEPKSAGDAIVLPKGTELAGATTTPSASHSDQAWFAPATSREFFDDSLGRAEGTGGAGAAGRRSGGSTPRDTVAAEGRQTEVADANSLGETEVLGAPKPGKLVKNDELMLYFRESPAAAVVANSAGDTTGLRGAGKLRDRTEGAKQAAPGKQAFARRYGLGVQPPAAKGAVEPAAPAAPVPSVAAVLDSSHSKQGNVGLADGVAEGLSTWQLQSGLKNSASTAPNPVAGTVELRGAMAPAAPAPPVATPSLMTLSVPEDAPAPAPAQAAPAAVDNGLEVARVPLQSQTLGKAAGDLAAAGRAYTPSRPLAETRRGAELLREHAASQSPPPAVAAGLPSATSSYYGAAAYGGYASTPPVAAGEKSQVPIVGDLPVAGALFRSDVKDRVKSQAEGQTPTPQEPVVNEAVRSPFQGFAFGQSAAGSTRGRPTPAKAGQPAPVAKMGDELLTQERFARSDTSKKAPNAPVVGYTLNAAAGQEPAKEPEPSISLRGISTPAKPDSKGQSLKAVTEDFSVAGDLAVKGPATHGYTVASAGSAKLGDHQGWDADGKLPPGSASSGPDGSPVAGAVPTTHWSGRLNGDEVAAGAIAKVEEKLKAMELLSKLDGVASGVEDRYISRELANGDAGAPKKPTTTEKYALSDRQRAERDGKKESDEATKVVAAVPPPVPQPEVQTRDNAFSTFSLNVSDASFKLAGASLEKGVMPEPASVRSEEFINAFDYRDQEPPPGVPVAFAWERTQYPFAQNRDLLRFSIKTAALGRQPGRPLNLVLLLDNSGSMERADRVQIIREALRVLAGQLQPQDKFSVVTFSRTAHLWVDGVPGNQAARVAEEVSGLTPQGGTNLEDAMNLAYQTALRHYLADGVNRVVLLTDGAANLGNVDPEALKQKVEANRKQGIALDCFGIGWEGYNDALLEVLSRNGDGRYGFLNTPEEAATEFAGQLAGALRVAASDVKVQVEFNPARVTAYRQIGYAKHQLTKEQFRDNTVDAAEIGAAESGNALYVVAVNPAGDGPLATVRVRYKVPGTTDYHEHAWSVPYTGTAVALEQASPAMRLAATASAFSEWLVSSPYAAEVTPDRLLGCLSGVPEVYGADARPKKLEWMIRQAKSIAGK